MLGTNEILASKQDIAKGQTRHFKTAILILPNLFAFITAKGVYNRRITFKYLNDSKYSDVAV